ncbi:MAG: hypothetical protein DIJKHBIC_02301 [Thermoanaerobaculia bacterium]|nr:hypothetical protein [Thermoanaerobaculia bacterium]
MASNDFLQPGTTTPLTLLFDRPREGSTRFGPYRAYRVRTPDGSEHTFLPPRSLFAELDKLRLGRGSQLTVRTSQRLSRDGRAFQQYEIAAAAPLDREDGAARGGGIPSSSPIPVKAASDRSSMLACVALKAAAASHAAVGNAGDVLKVAEFYLSWLEGRNP